MREIILASQSPRRFHLLQEMGVEFVVEPSNFDEKLDQDRPMHDVASELAFGKANDIAARHPDAIVIGSDTIVGVHDRQLEKPVDINDARRMLESYAGVKSEVTTGIAVVCIEENIAITDTDTANVFFKTNSPEIEALREQYLATNNWTDKAGGYGIQTVRDTLIDRIEGDVDTVIGLPTKVLAKILNDLGIPAHPVTVDPSQLYGK